VVGAILVIVLVLQITNTGEYKIRPYDTWGTLGAKCSGKEQQRPTPSVPL